jgi:MtrB/PioB family decaheme-associated outer membrane protein
MMRKLSCLLFLAVGLTPSVASGQTAAPSDIAPTRGWVDFGVRGSSITGDAARYERYRDLGDGLFLEGLRWQADTKGWLINLDASHVARRDQRYLASFVRPGHFKGWANWDQIPMLLSETTRSLYELTGANELRIADATQLQLQGLSSAARPPALLALVNSSQVFDLKSRRHIGEAGFEFLPVTASTIKMNFKHTTREGAQPYGGSFGHSQVVEFAAPIDHKLTDFDASAELERGRVLMRAGYSGSWFTNDVASVIFDNPLRATDLAATPSAGRLSLPVSNTRLGVNGMISVKMPRKSRLTAYAAISTLKDDNGQVLPLTINTAINAPSTSLSRTTISGEAKTTALNLSFVSRPSTLVGVNVRYRHFDYDNRAPEFVAKTRVSYDSSFSNLAVPLQSEPFGMKRQTLDADVRVTPDWPLALTVGASRNQEDRTHRIFESTVDNSFRVKLDSLSTGVFSVRTMYEYAQRRGDGFDVTLLTGASEQPGMRHFDLAERNRNRFTLVSSYMPVTNWAINLSTAIGRDDYLNSEFGLRDNNHNVYALGVDGSPSERFNIGASYSYEDYNSLQRSRQANPGAQFTDPSRNWATDAGDKVHSILANLDVLKIAGKVDLFLRYDYNRTRATYEYITGAVADRTLPEEVIVPTTLPTPVALAPVKSDLTRGTVDAVYDINRHFSVGLTYWYDRYSVQDFTLDSQAQSAVTTGNNMLLYYTYAPYTAHTTWGRLIVRW